MKFLVLFLSFFSVTSLWAVTANVVLLKGEASFRGTTLSSTSILKGNGEVKVGEKSYLKLLINESNTLIVFGSNTTSTINFADALEKHEVSLIKGIARWISGTVKGKGVKTSNAVMGIRGTDIFVSYNPLFGETEIICFDGSIQMTNAIDEKDSTHISKNQWGGIGGRFGNKISNVLSLSSEVLSSIEATLPK
jgi:FecR protein